eukprot:5462537-Prymnesium_polylepis.4
MMLAYTEFTREANIGAVPTKPGETSHFLNSLADFDVNSMRDALSQQVSSDANLEELEATFSRDLQLCYDHLDAAGQTARSVANNCAWASTLNGAVIDRIAFDLPSICSELEAVKNGLRKLAPPQRYRRVCQFQGSTAQQSGRQSYHFQVYHSLSYDSLRGLISALQPIKEYVEAAGQGGTVRDKLVEMYPGAAEDDYLSRAYIDLAEEEQRAVLLGTPAAELSQLCGFLREQIESEAYVFARKSLELKSDWTLEVDAELAKLEAVDKDLAGESRRLEASLIKYELRIAAAPDQPIHVSLARAFTSEASLLKELHILHKLKQAASNVDGFQFTGAHYVKLRRQLRSWVSGHLSNLTCDKRSYTCARSLDPCRS